MNGTVRTVLGDVNAETLGICQCHEHIFIEKCKSYEVSPVLLMEDYAKSLAELKMYKAAGGGALVDAQPNFSGRIAENLKKASEESGVQIIASTGFHKIIFYDKDSYVFTDSQEAIAEFYIKELTVGMLSSVKSGLNRLNAKAGIIKTAVDSIGIYKDPVYKKLFEAAAEAAKETGSPILCHTEQGSSGTEIIDFFTERGVSANKIILCHLDRADYNTDNHIECLKKGAYLEYDTINRLKYHDDNTEAELILKICAQGYEKQILLGLDTTNARLKNYGGDMGLDYILNNFSPFLREKGIIQEQIDLMLIKNPICALSVN